MQPFSLGDQQRVANVAVTTQVRSDSRSGERSLKTRFVIPAPMSAHAKLVPEHEMAQLGQGWELGLQPRWYREIGGPGRTGPGPDRVTWLSFLAPT